MVTERADGEALRPPQQSSPPASPAASTSSSTRDGNQLLHLPAVDPRTRQAVLHGSLVCAAVGGAGGAVLAVVRGRPLLWSMSSLALNAGLLSFAFLASTASLSSAYPTLLPQSSMRAQMLAGAVTGALATGMQRASRGNVSSAAEAVRAGGRGLLTGALLGAAVWAARRLLTASTSTSGRQLEAEQRPAAGSDSSDSGAPHWFPIRVSTAADLERDAAMKERRRQKGRQQLSDSSSASSPSSRV